MTAAYDLCARPRETKPDGIVFMCPGPNTTVFTIPEVTSVIAVQTMDHASWDGFM